MGSEEKIKYDDFHTFMKDLEFSYPLYKSAMEFKYFMINNLKYLKKEILNNFLLLDSHQKKAYLNRLKIDLEEVKQYGTTSSEELEKWYKKYNSPKESDPSFQHKNPLNDLLMVDPSEFRDSFREEYNHEAFVAQHDFYNYYYGFYVAAAIEYIDQQLKELELTPASKQADIQTKIPMQEQSPKLKVNLSVEQLAFLLKMLSILKPEIFEVKSEADLLRWISASFATKRSGEAGISVQKLRILFNQPDAKAADFWEKHLHTMIAEARKLK